MHLGKYLLECLQEKCLTTRIHGIQTSCFFVTFCNKLSDVTSYIGLLYYPRHCDRMRHRKRNGVPREMLPAFAAHKEKAALPCSEETRSRNISA
ncbi:hypothetical protein UPYG_G00001760 [Umbra pygmaea]|uniref:Uncharacterized protein n=1 Tax=Umbra pygmaea TaxID=75934 RepID=A0ABD0XXU7_UMBPY